MIKNFLTNAFWVVLIGSVLMFPMILAWLSGFNFERGPDLAMLTIGTVFWAIMVLIVTQQ